DVVFAPKDERLRLPLPEERLPLRIQVDVGAVVVEEVDLNLACIGALEEMQIHVPAVGADPLRIAVSVCVDKLDPVELEEGRERRLRLGAAVDPERVAGAVPGGGRALLV